MIAEKNMTENTYQWRLRALGAFFDAQLAADISVLEIGPRFATRYYDSRRENASPVFVYIEATQLQRISSALESRRLLRLRSPSPEEPRHEVDQGRYQDLLRGLGWELDDLEASQIVIDERVDGLYVSYQYTGSDGILIRKRTANLGVPEWETILHDARRRRKSS